MTKDNTTKIIIALGLAALVVVTSGVGYVIYQQKQSMKVSPMPTSPKQIAVGEPNSSVPDPTQEYRNDRYGFSVTLPLDWRVDEKESTINFLSPQMYASRQQAIQGCSDNNENTVCVSEHPPGDVVFMPSTAEIVPGSQKQVVFNVVVFTQYDTMGLFDEKHYYTTEEGQIYDFAVYNETYTTPIMSSFRITGTDTKKSALCTDAPTERGGIGGYDYPIDPKYKGFEFLGQFFTAYNCGDTRLKQFLRGDDVYDLGSRIILKGSPSQSLVNTFKSIGFTCAGATNDSSCTEWKLSAPVKSIDLIKLEPYYNSFRSDDCVNCG